MAGCRQIVRPKSSWPPGWRGSSTSRASPRSTSPTGWASAGSGSPGCSRAPGTRAWCASRSACPGSLDAGLSAELCSAFGLKHAFVFNFPDDDETAAAAPAGRGRGPGADGPHHARRRPRHVLVTHAERARGRDDPDPAVPDRPADRGGAVPRRPGPARPGRSVARVGGGPAHVFYAPMILDDAQTAAAIRRQGDIADAFALVPSVTIAVVAIGAWAPWLSTIYDAVTPAERDALAALGVRAELAGCSSARAAGPWRTSRQPPTVTPGPALSGSRSSFGRRRRRQEPRGTRRDPGRLSTAWSPTEAARAMLDLADLGDRGP